MARGRFGRRRSSGGNMAALVAQLLREQRAAQDRVMFDAYESGGLVDGKPVTDARILGYMRTRRDGFSQSDPLWTEWDNRLRQTDFSIGEQKIALRFREGKASAGAVAAFYRDALKGIPKDSAWYREVAGRAAQWAKSAASAARGAARASAEAGTRAKLNKLIAKAAQYDALEAAIADYARREGLITAGQSLSDADATALRAMFDRGIYAGEDRITFDDLQSAATEQYKNLDSQVDFQVQLGNQGIEARNRRDRFLQGTLLRLNVVDERAQYEMARDAWLKVDAQDPSPWEARQAFDRYREALETIHANAAANVSGTDANDPDFIGGIANEIAALHGSAVGPTVAEMYSTAASGDALNIAEGSLRLTQDLADLESGKAFYGQEEPGGPLQVLRWPTGGKQSLALDDSLQPMVTTVGGVRRTVYLRGEPIRAAAVGQTVYRLNENQRAPAAYEGGGDLDDLRPDDLQIRGNEVIDPRTMTPDQLRQAITSGQMWVTDGPIVGYQFSDPATGHVTYGVPDPTTGKLVFTKTNPFAGGEPFAYGDGLVTWSTSTTIERRGSRDFEVATPEYNREISLEGGFDPLMADGTVALKDLVALTREGIPGYEPADLADYQARLARRQQAQQALSTQRAGERDPLAPMRSVAPISDPRDVRSPVAQQIAAGSQALRSAFMANRSKDDDFRPPAAPKPPAPEPGFAPPEITPKEQETITKIGDLFGDFGKSISDTTDDILEKAQPPKVTADPKPKIGPGGYSHR